MKTSNTVDLFIKAQNIAREKHANQKYGIYPYTFHLFMVINVLQRFAHTNCKIKIPSILIAALLHDSIEDTDVTFEEIKKNFGEEVANLVWCVTNDKNIDKELRNIDAYKKMQSYTESITLKLADRIANVEFCLLNSNLKMFEKYKNEHRLFKMMLYPYSNKEENVIQMWKHLNNLFNYGARFI